MLTKQAAKALVKQAGLMDMLGGMTDYAPEGLGAMMGAGSAMGLSGGLGLGNKGQLISAAIGATIGAMAANKMKEHEQMQMQSIDSNSMLGIQNALMNLDQQNMLMGQDPFMMGMGQDPSMMGMGQDPSMMGMGMPASNPVSGYPQAQQAMQQPKMASANMTKIATALVDEYFK